MIQKMIQRVKYTAPYWWAPRRMAYYVGCVSLDNLGDELMLPTYRSLFTDWRFAHHRPVGPFSLQRALENENYRMAMLGGGTMMAGDGTGERHRRFAWAVKRYGNGVVFGSGVMWAGPEPRNSKIHRQLPGWADTLKACEYVGVRGPYSVVALDEVGVRAEMLGDPVCQLVRERSTVSKRPAVGINLGLIHDRRIEPLDQLMEQMCVTIENLKRQGLAVEFYVVRPGDESITAELAERTGLSNVPVHSIYYDPAIYLDRVSGLSLFIGLKLHAVALAMCAGVPTLSIAYEPKSHDFMHALGIYDQSLDMAQLTSDSLIAGSETLLDRGDTVANHARCEMMRLRDLQIQRSQQIARAVVGDGVWPDYAAEAMGVGT